LLPRPTSIGAIPIIVNVDDFHVSSPNPLDELELAARLARAVSFWSLDGKPICAIGGKE
jgi:hypothetical protein